MSQPNLPTRYQAAQRALLLPDEVRNGAVYPRWLSADRFWYDRTGENGVEYRVVEAPSGEWWTAATLAGIAASLSAHLGSPVDPDGLILTGLRFDAKATVLSFTAYGDDYEFNVADKTLAAIDKTSDLNWLTSPRGDLAVLRRDSNLWVRKVKGGDERALTCDGTETYAYGATPAAMRGLEARMGGTSPEALWSPDGKWLLTLQTDDRHVPEVWLADYAPEDGVRPRVSANRTSLPADPKVTEFRMLAIDIESGVQVEARYPRLSAVRMNSTPFGAKMAWWSADSRTAYFVDIARGESEAHVVAFDVATGKTRVVFSEHSDSYVEVAVSVYTNALITPLPETDELVWYSERTGRGHLYLYSLTTGACLGAITEGEWQVRDLIAVDAARRQVFLSAAGIAPDENPYITKPAIASLDGLGTRVLSALEGSHQIWTPTDMSLFLKKLEGVNLEAISGLSPDGSYFVETVSSVQSLPITYLRDREGREITRLEQGAADLEDGWQWPDPVELLAADGTTTTYGLLYKPLGFEPGQSYPLIDYIYGGPQTSNVPHSSFDGTMSFTSLVEGFHLSALGAFVLILDGRGTAGREQSFRTASHRAAHTASNLEDHVAAIRQLAERHSEIDLDRVGITGFSGGGYMTAHAALRFGDTFKVAVAGGGNYDQALFWHSWGERYHGAFEAEHYAVQAAKTYASGLTGKLMLVHGLRDEGCHPAGLFQLVQALIEANKDHDLVILPRAGHEWTGYGLRRRWDYFITHLFGEVPEPAVPFDQIFDRRVAKIKRNVAKPAAASAEQG